MKNDIVKAVLKGVSALFVIGLGTLLGNESLKNSKDALNKKEKE